jgi:hypothetical protein
MTHLPKFDIKLEKENNSIVSKFDKAFEINEGYIKRTITHLNYFAKDYINALIVLVPKDISDWSVERVN